MIIGKAAINEIKSINKIHKNRISIHLILSKKNHIIPKTFILKGIEAFLLNSKVETEMGETLLFQYQIYLALKTTGNTL